MIPPILAMSALEMSQFTWALATASEVVKGDLKRAEKLRGPCVPKFQMISTPTAYHGHYCLAPWCQARMKADGLHYHTAKKLFWLALVVKVAMSKC